MLFTVVLANLALGVFASPAPQAKGGACTPGGLQKGSETPAKDLFDDQKSGSGPYPAHFVQDGPSSSFTLYAPKTPPPSDVKLPVLVYATCGRQGTEYKNILNEVASRGYIVIAAGPPRGMGGSAQSATPGAKSPYPPGDAGNMKFAIDWIKAGNGKKYGNIDADNIATGGLSCGGLSSMDASRGNDKVKLTLVVHSGLLDASKTPQLKELKAPIAYIIGGPKDLAYCNAERDWGNLPNIPAVKVNLDSGHIGTMFTDYGGKEGKVMVHLLNSFLKNDAKSKALFFEKDSELVKMGFNITTKNW